jgi:hypothetical protein
MLWSDNPGKKPWSQVLNDAILELKGGLPVLLAFASPGGMKFSPSPCQHHKVTGHVKENLPS